MKWNLAFAQENLENLIDLAIADGPQHITQVDKPTVVLMSHCDYHRLKGPQRSLKDLILNGPDLTGVDLSRNRTPEREFDWE